LTGNGSPQRPDRRVVRTRTAVREALTELIFEKGYTAVTVTDIIDRANIGRSTFYANFTDKRDVFEDTVDELSGFLSEHRSIDDPDVFSFSNPLFTHIFEERAVISMVFGPSSDPITYATVAAALGDFVRVELQRHGVGSEHGSPPIDLVVEFVVGAFSSLVRYWLATDFRLTVNEMDAAFRCLVSPGVQANFSMASDKG
jgi:AcrR family transcriptional regulator